MWRCSHIHESSGARQVVDSASRHPTAHGITKEEKDTKLAVAVDKLREDGGLHGFI